MTNRFLPLQRLHSSLMFLAAVLLLCALSSLSYADSAPKMLGKARLIMGFYAHSITEMASLSDIEVSLNFWAKEFMTEEARKIGIEVTESRAILFETIAEMHEAMRRGELDMVIAPPLLLALNFKREELEDGFTGMLAGNRPDNLLFIARADKHLLGVQDLKGSRLALPENDEFAAMYLDSLFLQQFQRTAQQVARSIDKKSKASRIVLDIYFNQADAGIVYRNAYEVMAELNPDIARQVVIIEQYSIKSRNFSFFVHGYPFAKEMSSLAAGVFKASARAQQILEVFKTPELAKCAVSELDAYEQFYQRYQTLKAQDK